MSKDKRRKDDDDDNDYSRLKQLAKLMRGVKPKQRSKFHDRKSKREKTMRDIANEYNRDGEIHNEE